MGRTRCIVKKSKQLVSCSAKTSSTKQGCLEQLSSTAYLCGWGGSSDVFQTNRDLADCSTPETCASRMHMKPFPRLICRLARHTCPTQHNAHSVASCMNAIYHRNVWTGGRASFLSPQGARCRLRWVNQP